MSHVALTRNDGTLVCPVYLMGGEWEVRISERCLLDAKQQRCKAMIDPDEKVIWIHCGAAADERMSLVAEAISRVAVMMACLSTKNRPKQERLSDKQREKYNQGFCAAMMDTMA